MASKGDGRTSGDNNLNTNQSTWKSSASQSSRGNSLGTLSTRATVGTDSSPSSRYPRDFAETDTYHTASGDMLTYGIGSWTEAHGSHRAAAIDDVVEDSQPGEPAAKGKVNEQSVIAVGERRSDGEQKK